MKLITCNYSFIEIIPSYSKVAVHQTFFSRSTSTIIIIENRVFYLQTFSPSYSIPKNIETNSFPIMSRWFVYICSPHQHRTSLPQDARLSLRIAERIPKIAQFITLLCWLPRLSVRWEYQLHKDSPHNPYAPFHNNHFPSSFLESCCCCVRHMFCWNLWPHHNHQPHIME